MKTEQKAGANQIKAFIKTKTRSFDFEFRENMITINEKKTQKVRDMNLVYFNSLLYELEFSVITVSDLGRVMGKV